MYVIKHKSDNKIKVNLGNFFCFCFNWYYLYGMKTYFGILTSSTKKHIGNTIIKNTFIWMLFVLSMFFMTMFFLNCQLSDIFCFSFLSLSCHKGEGQRECDLHICMIVRKHSHVTAKHWAHRFHNFTWSSQVCWVCFSLLFFFAL